MFKEIYYHKSVHICVCIKKAGRKKNTPKCFEGMENVFSSFHLSRFFSPIFFCTEDLCLKPFSEVLSENIL